MWHGTNLAEKSYIAYAPAEILALNGDFSS